jgi:hypothetical protein
VKKLTVEGPCDDGEKAFAKARVAIVKINFVCTMLKKLVDSFKLMEGEKRAAIAVY